MSRLNREFVYSDLFRLLSSSFKASKSDLVSNGKTPAYSSAAKNNGCVGLVDREPSFRIRKSTPVYLVFGDHTRAMNIVREDFCVMDNVKVLVPLVDMSDEVMLYVATCWKKAIPDLGYARHWAVAKKVKFELPVVESLDADYEYGVGDIDFEYMQRYIAMLEQQRVAELERERDVELAAYLKIANLRNCVLSDEDKQALSEIKPMREFVIGEVFEKLKSPFSGSAKKQDSVSKEQTDEFSLPLINCKLGDNGIMYYGRPEEFTSHKQVLGVIYNGPPTEGQTYFHEEAGVYTDAYLIGLKGREIVSREIGLYLATALNQSIHNKIHKRYSRGDKATWEGKVEKDPILLPITLEGDIDFDYMERYIRAIEKLVIGDVAKSKDETISKTKALLNQKRLYACNDLCK